ncbi:Nucleolar protein 12 [Marasmius crinis-equi]|uniref:Nucleolar protein 12 n=1 Tax=Marasmius crinis-equi TaxID=585013 RepID=A0ABR3FUB7_9AGAR
MALSSLLLGGKKTSIDKELDSLFKTDVPTARPPPSTPVSITTSTDVPNLKRKHESAEVDHPESSKRVKGGSVKDEKKKGKQPKVVEKEKSKKREKVKAEEKKEEKKKKEKKAKPMEEESAEEEPMASDDEENADLENAYLVKSLTGKKGKEKAPENDSDDEEQEENDEDLEEQGDTSEESESDASPPQHESITKSSKKRTKTAKVKFVPSEETPEQRDSRTIFVGNLSVEVAQKKALRKQLQRHVLSLISTSGPKPKIESIRFRSVPFSVPTSTLPDDDKDDPKLKGKGGKKSKSSSRQHDLDRTSNWRDKNAEGETEKTFLTPAQKKKVAFISQDFHDSANNMHAYIVFAHPPPADAEEASKRKPNLPPPPETMDPYEAARLAQEACDGSLFMERMLRVDIAAKNPVAAAVNTEGRVVKTDVDPKKCVFVGNLDFESKEEDVRVFFEGVIKAEKGPRPLKAGEEDDSDGEEGDTGPRPRTWVKRVRIIRDKDTQLGKGFAYVQFVDNECVDEILALEPSKLKFAKRKLRVERCKTLPGVSTKLSSKPKSDKTDKSSKKSSRPTAPVLVPKGDPSLGEKLVHMSKEDRKKAKASDPERLARRLAKKKSRMALATPGKDSEGLKILGKDRNRERKGASTKGKGKTGVGSSSKSRVRSERNAARRNVKK